MTTPYFERDAIQLFLGDCRDVLSSLPDASVDALVTDPPAGISFMGREWDGDKGGRQQWVSWLAQIVAECRRLMKPGSYALVWALPRTSHWTATALEDGGLVIRDIIHHHHGQGWPKSKSSLKPATEHWILAANPADNLRPLRIDSCRVPTKKSSVQGRWPANLVLSHSTDCVDELCDNVCPVAEMDRQSGVLTSGHMAAGTIRHAQRTPRVYGSADTMVITSDTYADSGGASRFYWNFRYQAKAPRKDRGENNNHPTVKHTELMAWLMSLVAEPGAVILDPFAGSGSTLVAAQRIGYGAIGVEQDEHNCVIAVSRLSESEKVAP